MLSYMQFSVVKDNIYMDSESCVAVLIIHEFSNHATTLW
jgi:hypothetical protein